jgi:YHS domain-containing protein
MNSFHTGVKALAATAVLLSSFAAYAINPYFATEEGAIKGYDPVAYFTDSKAVKGDKQFSYQWQNAEWHFASAANLAAFKANPEKYAPQFGGYCAYGVSYGAAPPVDPTAYSIVGGKLYLNYNHAVSDKWQKDTAGYISKADKNWPGIKAGNVTEK